MRCWTPGIATLTLVFSGTLFMAAQPIAADEWEERTPYYEDDAWYDITEWFDGNDYNPTDEAAFRWDDESYDAEDDTGSDIDNDNPYAFGSDSAYWDDYDYTYDSIDNEFEWQYDPYDYYDYGDNSWYGYDGRYASDDWFYDYYDDGHAFYRDWDHDGLYDYYTRYYDYDNDGSYDAYYSYNDWDNDGLFEDVSYFSFDTGDSSSDQRNNKGADSGQKEAVDSKSHSITGRVAKTKQVSLPDAKHLVVALQQEDGSPRNIDLGPVEAVNDWDVSEGDSITAHGPMLKVGEKHLLLAQKVEMNGKSMQVNRKRRKISGEIADTRKVEIRDGRPHQLLILARNGKKHLVDLGPAEQLDVEFSEGDQVTVQGAPAKIQDRRLVLAESITKDDQTTQLRRGDRSNNRQRQSDSTASSGRNRANDNQQAKRTRQERSITGNVVNTRTATVRGKERQLATVKTQNGDKIIVDLGPASKLQTELQDGDQITARGIAVRANDQRILIARQLQMDGQTIRIGRLRSANAKNDDNQQRVRSQQNVAGEVLRTRTVSVQGQKRRIAHVETNQGNQVIVDMGPERSLDDFRIQKGDQINARGVPVKVRDQKVLVAMQLKSGDQSVKVDRRRPATQRQN